MTKKYWWMDIKDKTIISKTRFCPPHRWPHKIIFFGKKICDEPCHFHKKKWRMFHHCNFCKILKCPNYKYMLKKYKEHNDSN